MSGTVYLLQERRAVLRFYGPSGHEMEAPLSESKGVLCSS